MGASTIPAGLERTTDLLAEFALDTAYDDLPADVRHATRRVLLDTIGCTVGGFATGIGRSIVALRTELGGTPQASLLVGGTRLPAPAVSYVHSHLANAMDSDETYEHRAHFANVVTMPALAFAESREAGGEELLTAIAVGYEVAARICRSLPNYDLGGEEIRLQPLMGKSFAVFGTVAAVGRLVGLSRSEMANAMGLAFMSAPVHTPWMVFPAGLPRTMSKYAMYGPIAEAGANGVLLAAHGFTGHSRVLDPEHRFWTALGAPSCDYDVMHAALGDAWAIPETSFKLYPFGRQGNIVLDLALSLAREHDLELDDIERLVIRLPPNSVTAELSRPPAGEISEIDASFDLRHGLAVALAGLPPGPRWLDERARTDPRLRAFADRVDVEVRDAWRDQLETQIRSKGTFRRIPTEVEITTAGRHVTAAADTARGDPWSPESAATDDDLAAKFAEYTRDAVGEARAAAVVDALLGGGPPPGAHEIVGRLTR